MTEPTPVDPAREREGMAGDTQPRGAWGDVSFRLVDDEDGDKPEVSTDARTAGAVQEA